MMSSIPQADPGARFRRYGAEISRAFESVLKGDQFILGPAVESFEHAFAAYIGAKHCVGVASGTDALLLTLKALAIDAGDEVITVALTAAGTAQAICLAGATPVFVDVEMATRCIDPDAVTAAITPRTRAIVPVHLYGRVANMPALRAIADRHGLALIEDCAQAHGATYNDIKAGRFGVAGAFSFYPTKNLGCLGDGGAIVTDDPALAQRLRALRSYGWQDETRESMMLGYNSRLDEMQAAILAVLLPHLDEGNSERRQLAAAYRAALSDLSIGLPPDDAGCVYHQFAITSQDRDALRRHFAAAGIGTAVHYTPPLHVHQAFRRDQTPHLPRTEQLARELISLPIQPELAAGNMARLAGRVREGIRQWTKS